MKRVHSFKSGGYGLLISIVFLSLILLGLVVSENQQSLIAGILVQDQESSLDSAELARSCMYVALARLAADSSYRPAGESIPVDKEYCTILSILPSGNAYAINATASSGRATITFSANAQILQDSVILSLAEIH